MQRAFCKLEALQEARGALTDRRDWRRGGWNLEKPADPQDTIPLGAWGWGVGGDAGAFLTALGE